MPEGIYVLSRVAGMPALAAILQPDNAHAATSLDGTTMGWRWALPFAGILLSIATGPLLFPKIWHRRYGKISAGWSLLTLGPLGMIYGWPPTVAAFVHVMLAEYLRFIVLLFVLYTVAGGILVTGTMRARHMPTP